MEEKTFAIELRTGQEIAFKSLEALEEFLITIETFREEIISTYEKSLYEKIDDAVIFDTIQELDILATHYWVEGTCINEIIVDYIDEAHISVLISGSVDVNHQYGSDIDYRRGDGLRFHESYPFNVRLKINVNTPYDFNIYSQDIEVDNSKFYD
ncbi:MAG: hypothetical protein JJT76_02805 [Clostridiaceae bacterium]|nr:hypothetical protein [Clostridiaceae bacterium]